MSLHTIKYYLYILLFILINVKCSYVSDFLEGELTKRASFSIKADYDQAAQILHVSWSDNSPFAYEIYASEEMNDEYADYMVIAAPADIGDVIVDNSLLYSETEKWSCPVTFSNVNGPAADDPNLIIPVNGGRLFIRVGHIDSTYDEEDEDGHPIPIDRKEEYLDYDTLSEISGYKMVEIYP